MVKNIPEELSKFLSGDTLLDVKIFPKEMPMYSLMKDISSINKDIDDAQEMLNRFEEKIQRGKEMLEDLVQSKSHYHSTLNRAFHSNEQDRFIKRIEEEIEKAKSQVASASHLDTYE